MEILYIDNPIYLKTNKYINPENYFLVMQDHPYLQLKGFLSFLILHELGQKALCGDDLAIKIGKRKGAKLTPGTIYPALKDLRKQKFISYKKFGRKKIYTLSDGGRNELERLYVLFSQYFIGLKQHIKRNPVLEKRKPSKLENRKTFVSKKPKEKKELKVLRKDRSFYHG